MIALPKPLAALHIKDWNKGEWESIAIIGLSDGEKWDCVAVDGKGNLIWIDSASVTIVDGDVRDAIFRAEMSQGS